MSAMVILRQSGGIRPSPSSYMTMTSWHHSVPTLSAPDSRNTQWERSRNIKQARYCQSVIGHAHMHTKETKAVQTYYSTPVARFLEVCHSPDTQWGWVPWRSQIPATHDSSLQFRSWDKSWSDLSGETIVLLMINPKCRATKTHDSTTRYTISNKTAYSCELQKNPHSQRVGPSHSSFLAMTSWDRSDNSIEEQVPVPGDQNAQAYKKGCQRPQSRARVQSLLMCSSPQATYPFHREMELLFSRSSSWGRWILRAAFWIARTVWKTSLCSTLETKYCHNIRGFFPACPWPDQKPHNHLSWLTKQCNKTCQKLVTFGQWRNNPASWE